MNNHRAARLPMLLLLIPLLTTAKPAIVRSGMWRRSIGRRAARWLFLVLLSFLGVTGRGL